MLTDYLRGLSPTGTIQFNHGLKPMYTDNDLHGPGRGEGALGSRGFKRCWYDRAGYRHCRWH